jgi:transposase-like protein
MKQRSDIDNRMKKTTKPQTKPPVDREAVRILAIELGAREAARKLGLNENTVLSWARREIGTSLSAPAARKQSRCNRSLVMC